MPTDPDEEKKQDQAEKLIEVIRQQTKRAGNEPAFFVFGFTKSEEFSSECTKDVLFCKISTDQKNAESKKASIQLTF